jgi:acyl-CoA thioester hydrolase
MERSEFSFFFPFRIRYAETDAQGIVFYGNYLIFFDTAIYEYFRALPFDFDRHVKDTGADFHTFHVSMDFHAPARFDDHIEAGVRTRAIGRTSLTFEVGIFAGQSSQNLVTGRLVWVNTDQASHRSVPLPDELIHRIRDFEPSSQLGGKCFDA